MAAKKKSEGKAQQEVLLKTFVEEIDNILKVLAAECDAALKHRCNVECEEELKSQKERQWLKQNILARLETTEGHIQETTKKSQTVLKEMIPGPIWIYASLCITILSAIRSRVSEAARQMRHSDPEHSDLDEVYEYALENPGWAKREYLDLDNYRLLLGAELEDVMEGEKFVKAPKKIVANIELLKGGLRTIVCDLADGLTKLEVMEVCDAKRIKLLMDLTGMLCFVEETAQHTEKIITTEKRFEEACELAKEVRLTLSAIHIGLKYSYVNIQDRWGEIEDCTYLQAVVLGGYRRANRHLQTLETLISRIELDSELWGGPRPRPRIKETATAIILANPQLSTKETTEEVWKTMVEEKKTLPKSKEIVRSVVYQIKGNMLKEMPRKKG